MRKSIFILMTLNFIGSTYIFCQSDEKVDFSQDWKNEILNNPNIEEDITDAFIKRDLSHLWASDSTSSELGIIGKNYYKIQIHIDNVTQDKNDRYLYKVQGKSKVRDNICSFNGNIKVLHVLKNKYSINQNHISGDIIAHYKFCENKEDPHSGYFEGILNSWWHLDTLNNKLFLETGANSGDGFQNNTYVGVWVSYRTNRIKKCIWGQNRLPFTEDFDIGTGEMYVNQKYVNNGWILFNTRNIGIWPIRHYDKTKWW